VEEAFEAGVHGALHRPEQESGDAIVLTHGAGSNANAPPTAASLRILNLDDLMNEPPQR